MNATAIIPGCSPIWADYVWFARGERSRLYPVIRDFLVSLEAAARSVSLDALNQHRRKWRRTLLESRGKYFLYALRGVAAKQEKYRTKMSNKPRAIRDAAMNLATRSLRGGTLTQIMQRCGSDKGGGKHNYTLFYERLLGGDGARGRVARVFELGIGTMGADGAPGASLKGWQDYFPNAQIFGGDIDKDLLIQDRRITTSVVDQTDPVSIEGIFSRFGDQYDLIVEDGCHQVEASRIFFEHSFDRLKDDGFYVIEDVLSRRRDEYKAFLRSYDAAILDIPHDSNHEDNCLAIIVKDQTT